MGISITARSRPATVVATPETVEGFTIVNGTAYDLEVETAARDGDAWLPLARVGAGTEGSALEVIDQIADPHSSSAALMMDEMDQAKFRRMWLLPLTENLVQELGGIRDSPIYIRLGKIFTWIGIEDVDVRSVRIGDRDDVDPGQTGERAGMERSHPADTDDPDAHQRVFPSGHAGECGSSGRPRSHHARNREGRDPRCHW